MILTYFKQAWQLLKQNKLYSTVYIIGTGLAIATTMTIALVYYIKIAPVYPETNRMRAMVAKSMKLSYKESNGMSSSSLSYEFVKEHIQKMKTPEAVGVELGTWNEYPLLQLSDGKNMLSVTVKYVNDGWWRVFQFDFLSGREFTEEEFQSGVRTAIISAAVANKLFGTTEGEGRRIVIDGNEYRVCGVVRDVSYATPVTYADIWVPLTIRPDDLKPSEWGEGLLGSMITYFLLPPNGKASDTKAEADAIIQKINAGQEKFEATMSGQPELYWKTNFRHWTNMEIGWTDIFERFGIMLLALLLIPAVNLAGMVSSRMEKRLPEMGIRKSFGASRSKLLGQILTENLMLTTLGGLAGLVFSYLIIYSTRSWILHLFDIWSAVPPEGAETVFTPGMLFNPTVFLIAFGVCFILNLFSAIVPAYYGLKKTIIYSLSQNK